MNLANAARTIFFVLACFCLGIEQRLWAARVKPHLARDPQATADLQVQLQEQQARLNEELSKLPPDSQKFFEELFMDAHQEMLVSPIVRDMQKMTFAANDPDEGARVAQFRYERFKWCESVLETALWIIGAGVIVVCVALALLGKHDLGRPLADSCLSASHAWFFAISCLSALWAGLSLKNPWLQLPLGFYLAPIAASAAALLSDQSEEALLRAGAALLAPIVCAALSFLAAALA